MARASAGRRRASRAVRSPAALQVAVRQGRRRRFRPLDPPLRRRGHARDRRRGPPRPSRRKALLRPALRGSRRRGLAAGPQGAPAADARRRADDPRAARDAGHRAGRPGRHHPLLSLRAGRRRPGRARGRGRRPRGASGGRQGVEPRRPRRSPHAWRRPLAPCRPAPLGARDGRRHQRASHDPPRDRGEHYRGAAPEPHHRI
mmetsp:Transcript_9352/g.28017  ORF Transcript_9352/g.28017 Transcript_9352/m.28017 type:complete len:202 (+) Transcript_9352:190-795(+)